MGEFRIQPADVFGIVRRHKLILLAGFVSAFMAVMALYAVVPRTYRSEAVIHIGVNYFQNPLIGDLISQTHDPGELRAEREKIIKSALGVEFANKMGEKYGLFKTTSREDPARAVEVEYFLKSLDVAPVTTTQFSIKYKGRSSKTVDGIIHATIDAIREHMYATRVRQLEEFFAVLQDEILNAQGKSSTSFGGTTNRSAEARASEYRGQITAQVQVLERRLVDLRRAYSENHPSVRAVVTELSELKEAEQGGGLSAHLTRRRRVFSSGGKENSQSTIKEDLRKQEHLLSISLEMEKKDPTMAAYVTLVKEPIYPKTPVFPKLRLFLLSALIAGIMASTIAVAVAEFWERTDLPPDELARRLVTELFGKVVLPLEGA